MWMTYQLRPTKYPTKSAQPLYHSILANFNALARTHLELVLCNSCVILQIEVYRPLLFIYVDDISTPTSGLSSGVRMTLRYSVTAKSKMTHQDTFSAYIMWYISDLRGFIEQASSMHPYERYINSNLGYDIHRS